MRFRAWSIMLCVLAIALTSAPPARANGGIEAGEFEVPLEGRHGIAVNAGLLNISTVETETGAGGVRSETRASGFLGSLSYCYWAGADWAVEASVGVYDVESWSATDVDGISSESAAVVPILFGVSIYPSQLTIGSAVRPYASVAAGPYVGFATNRTIGATIEEDTVVESVPGARLRAGADVFVSDSFRLGISGGYHFISEFDETIGEGEDYSGPEFSLSFGFLWGSGK
jgi:hypothetical protein